jgi:hypothetical protein
MEPMPMMAVEHYAAYRWVQAPIAALCVWLVASPFTFGYANGALMWSDVLSGIVALAMSLLALKPRTGCAKTVSTDRPCSVGFSTRSEADISELLPTGRHRRPGAISFA